MSLLHAHHLRPTVVMIPLELLQNAQQKQLHQPLVTNPLALKV